MLDKVDDTLSALINETQDRDVRTLYLETKDKALAQRKTIAEQFGAQYLREFQVRSNRVKKIGQSFSEFDSSSLELDLVGEDDLNETLKVNDMATKLRQYCDEELVALDQRVGVLLGDANLEAEDNPFSPQAICDAFKHTCRSVVSNVKVRMVFLKLFDDHVLDDIRSIYKAVNALLVQNSILPKIRFAVSRGKEGSKAPSPDARAGEAPPGAVAHAADRVPSGEPDFFSVLQNLIASNVKAMTQSGVTGGTGASAQGVAAKLGFSPIPGTPGLGGADGAPVVVLQGAELTNFLTRIQHGDLKAVADGGLPLVASAGEPGTTNVLRELKATSLGTGMNQLDSMTLDIIAMLFDQLFDDPKIPIAVKGLIGRMQIPMLKVAIADKAFFSKKTHPARRLLDTLGEISSRLPADFNASNPLFGRLEAIIQELMNNFQDSIEIFDVVRERLQILVEEEDQRVEQETRSAAKRIEQNESLATSKTMAEFEVKARVQAGKLPRPVIEFLVHQWIKPLLIVHVRRGQHSDAWKNALETMDLLISSVEPKHTPEERRKLTTVVPELLTRLAAGLKIADVDDAIRERFFSEKEKTSFRGSWENRERPKAPAPPDTSIANNTAIPDLPTADAPSVEPLLVAEIAAAPMEAIQPEPMPPAEPVGPMPFDLPLIAEPEPAAASAAFDRSRRLRRRPDPLPPFDLSFIAEPAPAPMEAVGLDSTPPPEPAVPIPPLDLPSFDLPLVAESALAPIEAVRPDPAPPAKPSAPTPTLDLSSFDLPLVAAPASAPREAVRPVPTPPPTPAAPTPTVALSSFDLPLVPPPASAPKQAHRPAPTPPDNRSAPSESKAANQAPVNFNAAVTINNPFGQGEVQVDDLDFTTKPAAGTARAKQDAGHATVPENLTAGTWVAIRTKGEKDTLSLAKLSYVSPLKSRYLFVDRHGKTTLECSRTELARRFSLGELVITKEVSEPPLFDRLAAGLVGKLGGPKAPR